jgi:hypothetical protein
MAQSKSTVGGSVARVVLFWWIVGLVWVGLSDARLLTVLHGVRQAAVAVDTVTPEWLARHLPWNSPDDIAVLSASKVVPLTFKPVAQSQGVVSAQEALWVMVSCWSVFALAFVAVLSLVGLFVGMTLSSRSVLRRGEAGRVHNDNWLGVNCSIGPLARPIWMRKPKKAFVVTNSELEGWMSAYAAAHPLHETALRAILGVIASHDAQAGEGHDTLAHHTENVLAIAVKGTDPKTADPLIALLAASHDLGKVITHASSVHADNVLGYHDTLGMRILAGLDSVQALPFDDRDILMLLTGFAHKPADRPEPHHADARLKARLMHVREAMHQADAQATALEQDAQRQSADFETIIERAFIDALKLDATRGKASCVHVHDRRPSQGLVYLRVSETKFSKILEQTFGENVAAAGGDYRRMSEGGMAGVTRTLMAWLEKKGWLVTDLYGVTAKHHLYDVVAGELAMNGVFFVNVAPDLEDLLKRRNLLRILAANRVFALVYVQDHHLRMRDLPDGKLVVPFVGCEPGSEGSRDVHAAKRIELLRQSAILDSEDIPEGQLVGAPVASSKAPTTREQPMVEADVALDFVSLVDSKLQKAALIRAISRNLKAKRPGLPPLQHKGIVADKLKDILAARAQREALALDDGKPPIIIESSPAPKTEKPKPKADKKTGRPMGGAFLT